MAIASGEITITTVNDGYSVLLTPDALTFSADFDGSHPDLSSAVVTLEVAMGGRRLPFKVRGVDATPGVTLSDYSTQSLYTSLALQILSVPTDALNGFVRIDITVEDGTGSECSALLRYSVLRESSMLDWIMDWEGSKTKIGGTYIMTPKMFIGRKDQVIETEVVDGETIQRLSPALTGVYIGPEEETSGLAPGIYGYLQGDEIFHLNANGGNIGGWDIRQDGLRSPGGNLSIKSSGSIEAKDNADILWGIYEDGNAVFAKGNIHFFANGDADFKGTITSEEGEIGGWTINDSQLYNKRVALDSGNNCLGVVRNEMAVTDGHVDLKTAVNGGGVMMYYNNASDFGLIGHTSAELVFQLGSTNKIGCWNFTSTALYSGTLNNATSQFTAASGDITIGSRGIRGYKWRIDDDGTAAFSGGLAQFDIDSANFFGWNVVNKRFSDKHIALVSENDAQSTSGLYISGSNLSSVSIPNLKTHIHNNGGVYITSVDNGAANIYCYTADKKLLFSFTSSGTSNIGPWKFDDTAFYYGTKATSGFTVNSSSITIGTTGIRGLGWRLESDGSGALASGKIAWNADGSGLLAGGNIAWNTDGSVSMASSNFQLSADGTLYLTNGNITLNSDGSATLAKGNIVLDTSGGATFSGGNISLNTDGSATLAGGNISIASNGTVTLANGNITLNADGSGSFSSGNIVWDTDGNATFSGSVSLTDGSVSGWTLSSSQIGSQHAVVDSAGVIAVTKGVMRPDGDGIRDPKTILASSSNGGGVIMHYTSSSDFGLKGYASDGKVVFSLGSSNSIGPWNFTDNSFYIGTEANTAGTFAASASDLTIGLNGIRSKGWRLEKDGSGALASGKIFWDTVGNATIEGCIRADSGYIGDWNISDGKLYIGGKNLQNGFTSGSDHMLLDSTGIRGNGWRLESDGSGALASGKIYWDTLGNATVEGCIKADSGFIGDWHIEDGKLYIGGKTLQNGFTTGSGHMLLDSTGIRGNGWRLESDGSGALSAGNISWDTRGNASFTGRIQATRGFIGGWKIEDYTLHSGHMGLDSQYSVLGICFTELRYNNVEDPLTHVVTPMVDVYNQVSNDGGVMIFNMGSDWGLRATDTNGEDLLWVGSENFIGPWKFDKDSIYIGDKLTTAGVFTANNHSITLGLNGIRGYRWRFETDGSGSLAGGNISWGTDGNATFKGRIEAESGEIGGWILNYNTFYCQHIGLDADYNVLAVTREELVETQDGWIELKEQAARGGVKLFYNSDVDWGIKAVNQNGNTLFSAGAENFFGGWYFDDECIYTGWKNNTAGRFSENDTAMTIGSQGLRGYKWRLEANGSGSLAGGNLVWTAGGSLEINGKVTAEEGKIAGWTIDGEDLKMNRTYLSGCDVAAGLFIAHNTATFEGESHDHRYTSIMQNGGAFITDIPSVGGAIGVSGGNLNGGTTFLAMPGYSFLGYSWIEANALCLNINPNVASGLPAFINKDASSWGGQLPAVKDGVCMRCTIVGRSSLLELTTAANVEIMSLKTLKDANNVQKVAYTAFHGIKIAFPYLLELYGYKSGSTTTWLIDSPSNLDIIEITD